MGRIRAFVALMAALMTAPAFALGAGGTAPGGPLSGNIRASGNGYNMDGTRAEAPVGGG